MVADPGTDVAATPGPLESGAGASLLAYASGVVTSPIVYIVARRLVLAVPLLLVVSALTFVLISITPGEPAQALLPRDATPEQVDQLNHELGLDRPVHEQYADWIRNALGGDLGSSLQTQEPVTTTISQRFPTTLSLMLLSLLVIVIVGVGLGILSAVYGGALGRIVDGLSLIGFALPGFWVGAVLISIFAVKLQWLPAVGYVPFGHSPQEWARSLILPVAALAIHSIAVMSKQTREAMMDVLVSEHIRMARANGIRSRAIYFKLALKATSVRVITIAGLQAIGLLGGAIFVEQVFALPGLGSQLVGSATSQDLPVVQGLVVFFTLLIVIVNLIVDLVYGVLDPRVRTS